MTQVGWLIVLSLPVYAAVQLYLIKRVGEYWDVDAEEPTTEMVAARLDRRAIRERQPGEGEVLCRACGTVNDASFGRCRECAARMPRVAEA